MVIGHTTELAKPRFGEFEVEDHVERGDAGGLEIIVLGEMKPDERVLALPAMGDESQLVCGI